ncbi:MAG: class I SAM-dependent methyltransferase [Patescibacteria group bacterium]|nr:class I SAM-dependent methyltransferase [Patescibacteria group bacterium]
MSIQKQWENIMNNYEKKGLGDKATIFAHEIFSHFEGKKNLLDLGAGLGQDSRFFCEKGFMVTSTDFSSTALEISKQKDKSNNIKYCKVDLGEIIPFENESFDVVYSHLALHYLNHEKTQRMFNEIHRILKKDGIIASIFNTIEDPEIKEENFEKIEDNYYLDSWGMKKRYFCVECLDDFTKGKFDPVIIDNKGKTYKDDIECLIRLVARKI